MVSTFCFCVQVKNGVYMIGVLSLLTFSLSAVTEDTPWPVKFEGVASAMFLMMLCRDSARSRLLFLVAFCIGNLV